MKSVISWRRPGKKRVDLTLGARHWRDKLRLRLSYPEPATTVLLGLHQVKLREQYDANSSKFLLVVLKTERLLKQRNSKEALHDPDFDVGTF